MIHKQTTPKLAKKVKQSLDTHYSYLGGQALGRDKKGRVIKDDSTSADVGATGGDNAEYTPYVYYEFSIE